MTRSLAVILTALGATAFFALATALKHRSAGLTPDVHRGERSLGGFLLATLRHPLWLGGIGADVGGLSLQITALHLGPLSVVQPVMITALIFSLAANHRIARTKVSKRELLGGATLVLALGAFLWISGAASPEITGLPQPADPEPAFAIGAGAVLLALICVVSARRLPRGGAAGLIGVTVGVIYACTAALIKSCSNIALGQGPLALLTSWQLYLLLVAGAAGLIGSQLAFQAGPLRASLPAIATVDPLVSITLGVFVYGERLRSSLGAVIAELLCLLVLCVVAIYLSRLTGVQEAPERSGRPRPAEPASEPAP